MTLTLSVFHGHQTAAYSPPRLTRAQSTTLLTRLAAGLNYNNLNTQDCPIRISPSKPGPGPSPAFGMSVTKILKAAPSLFSSSVPAITRQAFGLKKPASYTKLKNNSKAAQPPPLN